MTFLELGFKEYAKECRLPEKQAAYMFNRAAEHPQFLKIIQDSYVVKESEDISFASNLVHQDSLDRDIRQAFNKLKMS